MTPLLSALSAVCLSTVAGFLLGTVATATAGEPLYSWLRKRLPTGRRLMKHYRCCDIPPSGY